MTDSSTSSSDPTSVSPRTETEEDLFQIAPLLGLCKKPKHLMTEEELREDIAKLREQRMNRFAFNKRAEETSGDIVLRQTKKEKVFEEFDV